MKSNNIKVYQKMSSDELNKEIKVLQEGLFKLRFQKVVEETRDTSKIKKAKRQIAQIKTVLRLQEVQK